MNSDCLESSFAYGLISDDIFLILTVQNETSKVEKRKGVLLSSFLKLKMKYAILMQI